MQHSTVPIASPASTHFRSLYSLTLTNLLDCVAVERIDEHDLTTSLYADIIQMMHGSEWTLKYDEPEIENVALELHPRATFSTSGSCSSYFNVARTTVLHMFCRMANQ